MITNVQQAVYPLLLICSVFGMGIYFPKKFYLNILYNLTVWTSYGYLYYYVVTAFKAEMWLQSISNIIVTWIGVLTSIIIIIMSVHRDKKFRLFMKRLTAIDDTLEELGTPKRYQKLHTCAKRVLIGWLVCSYTLNTFDTTWWIHVIRDHWCIIIPYIINHFHHVNMLMDLLFMTFLWCASEMEKIIHQLTDSFQYTDIHNEIYQFSLQIIHHPLKFTGLGLFYFGSNFVQKVDIILTRMKSFFIFGFGIIRCPFDHPRVYLSFFYILIVWSVYVYVFYYVINIFSPKSMFNDILKDSITIINMLVTIISVIKTFRNSKKFRMCIKKLNFVDNTLELLGTPKEYHRMRNSVKWIFILWFIMVCTTWFTDSLWYIEKYNDVRAMFIPIMKDYFLHINTFIDIMYMFLLSLNTFYFTSKKNLTNDFFNILAKKTKDMIHKLTNLICFTEAREEIVQFVLQISLRPLKFSGLGLFYFGYNFVHKTAISPLSVVLCLCGFGVFEYPQNQPRFCLTIFYILISWLSYAYIAFQMAIFLRKNELTYTTFHYTNMVFAILYMLSNFYYNKKFKSCLDKLNIVSNTIEKLGTSKNYTKLRIQTTWLITGWIILVSLIDINDYVWYREHIPRSYSIMAICVPIGNHPIHINTLYDFMYMMLLRYIGFQFEHVNKYIQKLAKQKKVGYAWANSTSPLTHRHIAGTKTLSKQNIWILM
ncbi:hypothetical protein ALC57_01831 [Trachymyrmex cornetzi]|uniref:Gustatory receptor n=1 Tax=Trachymyrmex cornetzi TaxID=471704 RepID=A0A195ELR5_9HYME|nr:hypothetical protein ALC57_01831 [Trachymyrmex cornetzi]